jgi:hypothetical protein
MNERYGCTVGSLLQVFFFDIFWECSALSGLVERADKLPALSSQVSFDMPEYTADVDGVGVLRLLNAIRICGLEKKCKLYQASTRSLSQLSLCSSSLSGNVDFDTLYLLI